MPTQKVGHSQSKLYGRKRGPFLIGEVVDAAAVGWSGRVAVGRCAAGGAEEVAGGSRGVGCAVARSGVAGADRVEGQQIVDVTDNISTRGTEEVQQWLQAHPRWDFQFTPTHASWLNEIEIFFSILYRRLPKHGVFTSEDDLAQQMLSFTETYNQTAKPFTWTYTGKTLNA